MAKSLDETSDKNSMGAIAQRNPDEINEIIPIHEVDNLANMADISVERSQFGRADTLRYAILNLVVEGQYDAAIRELELYHNSKDEYPRFRYRTERFISYSIDLINAIRAKRDFPGYDMLRRAKRHELNERVHGHFGELRHILSKIENIEVELKVEDLRSTVWVLKTISACAVFAFVSALLYEAYVYRLPFTFATVVNDFYVTLTNWIL